MASLLPPSVNEWDNEYARLARVASQLRTQGLNANNNANSTPIKESAAQLQQHLTRLENQLNTLPVSAAEVQRRRRLIHHLQQTPQNSGMMNTASTTTISPPPQGQQQQQQSQMAMAMRQQDEMIDELAIGVGRLRDQTLLIGDEARMHVNLLGEMEGNLDLAQAGLENETRRAAQLKEDQSVWRLQLTVAGLSVLFVLLILIGIS